MNIRTESIHFTADEKLLTFIESKLSKLTQFYDRIIDVHVVLKLENSGQVKDKIVEVKVNIPGDTLISKDTKKTFEAAADSAIDTIRRQLRKHKERQRSF